MTQEQRPTPELWRLEYLRKWHGQPDPICCVKWFESELCAALYRDEIANGKGEVISLAKYVAIDPAYVLPDPPRTITPEQVERARNIVSQCDYYVGSMTKLTAFEALMCELLREVIGNE